MVAFVLMPVAGFPAALSAPSQNQQSSEPHSVGSSAPASDSLAAAGFTVKPGPPPGFELLEKNSHQSTYISIFYGGEFVTNILADFDNNTLEIHNPVDLLQKIPHLSPANQKILLQALSGKIPTHQELLCPYEQGNPSSQFTQRSGSALSNPKQECDVLVPKVAGVILDTQNYRAHLFINPDYLEIIRHDHDALPNSSAGFSFLSQNLFQATKVQNFKGATWTNTSILGEGNNQLTSNFGYTESWTDSGIGSPSAVQQNQQFSLNKVTAGRYDSGVLYQAGMVNENTGDFFTPPSLGGVNIQNYGVFTDLASDIKGSPLIIYLPTASNVIVRRQGQILAALSLNPGRQEIDTTNFPIGAYNVDITVTSQAGQVTTQTQFYVKQETLPESSHHNFDFAFGFLQKSEYNTSLNQTLTAPSFMNVPILSYYDMRKLAKGLGIGSTLMTSTNRAYLSEVVHLYEDSLEFSPGAVVSSQGDSGVRFGTEYLGSFMSVNFQGFRMWPRQSFLSQTNALNLINQSAQSFYPLPTSLEQAQSNISFFGQNHQVSLGGGWYKNFDGSLNRTESINYTRSLVGGETGNLMLGLSLTHQDQVTQINAQNQFVNAPQEDTIGMASLTYNFYTTEINGSAVLKLSNQNQNIDGSRPYEPGVMLSASHTASDALNHSWTLTGSVDAEKNNQSYGVDLNGVSPIMEGDASVTQNQFNAGYGQNNTQYTASLQSTVAYASGHWAMGDNQGYSTGIVVEVDSPEAAHFSLYDNDNYVGEFSTNHSHSIFVQPYRVHRLTIQPNTRDIYHFDQNPKEIVLYQGNVQYLHWSLERQYLLFAKILHRSMALQKLEQGSGQASGQASDIKTLPVLSNYLLNNQGEYDTTDDNGYVQAGLTEKTQKLIFEGISGDRCQVLLPQDMPKRIEGGVAVLSEPLVCEEIAAQK